jgi:hypothetical protein
MARTSEHEAMHYLLEVGSLLYASASILPALMRARYTTIEKVPNPAYRSI